MAERLRIVARAFKTFQQTNLQRLFFGFSTGFSQQSLQFSAMCQISDFVTKTEGKLTVLSELFGIWIFVNAIDRWDRAFFQFTRHRFVRHEHEFFDQLMRFIVLDALEPYWF